jgi:hypothetical protein
LGRGRLRRIRAIGGLAALAVVMSAGGLLVRQSAWKEGRFAVPSLGGASDDSFTLLTANVGNSDPLCLPYYLKLCRKDVETRVAANIQALQPDVVAIQEIMPDYLCERYSVAIPGTICAEPDDIPQIRRLLGPDYSIVCDGRNGFECIGVRVEVGEIIGCELGGLCETDRLDDQPAGCRWNVAIMAATVRVKDRTFDLINAHPESRSAACRLASIRQIFRSDGLLQHQLALVAGDLNLDPWQEDDVSTRYWNELVGPTGSSGFDYHSGIAEHQPPYPTLRYGTFKRTYDHVVSNLLSGVTQVLGESQATTRLDGGKGTDHRAVFGRLSFPEDP